MPIIDDDFLARLNSQLGETSSSLVHSEDYSKLFKHLERLCQVRERSSEELRRRFLKEDYNEETIEEVLERAQACGLISDERFADTLVRSRLSAGHGRYGIVRELEDLHIPIESVDGWPEEFNVDNQSQLSAALALLRRKPPTSKQPRNAAYQKLMRKGYDTDIALSAARIWSDEVSSR